MSLRKLGVLLLFLLSLSSQAAASFIGPVVAVLDGDTIEVLYNTHPPVMALTFRATALDFVPAPVQCVS